MVIRRSVSIAAQFFNLPEIEIYRPGSLDPSNLVSGAVDFGQIPDLWAIGELTQPATLQLFSKVGIESFPVAMSQPAPLQPGNISFSFMRDSLPRQRNFPFLKVSSEMRLIVRLDRPLQKGESLSISGFADEEAEPIRSWDGGIERALAAEMVKEWVRAQIESRGAIIPPGIPGFYAGLNPPEGWLVADGSEVERDLFDRLFAAIGTLHGAGDGISTFNIPDLRGVAYRGLDLFRTLDPLRVLGSFQDDAMQGHWHIMQKPNVPGGGAAFGPGNSSGNSSVFITSSNVIQQPINDGMNGEPRISHETVMKNVALLPIISY
ncbi:MAG: phage tail protein [Cyanobacteria bacterium P01_E01_bin.42]